MTEDNVYPVWIDDKAQIDPAWIRQHTSFASCTSCSPVVDMSNQGRVAADASKPKDGATLKLTVVVEDKAEETSVIVKQVPESGRVLAQQLGLAREALFYKHFRNELPDSKALFPDIYYSNGNVAQGTKFIMMQDLSDVAVDSAVFFGPGNPNSWNKDLKAKMALCEGNHTSADVAKATFVAIAKIHAHFWHKSDLLLTEDKAWLRGHAWLQGQGKESWQASQGYIQQIYDSVSKEEMDQRLDYWDPLVRECMIKTVQGISWEAQLKRLNSNGPWTLVHGDFWPGNVMWMKKAATSIRLVDWEMCGVGSGPQDLGQYILSNMEPSERRACEQDLIQSYHDELVKCGVNDDSVADGQTLLDYCWKEYTIGGVERWLWFLVYFLGQHENPKLAGWAQFFHNQIAAFLHDHKITPDDLVQVRP